MDFIIDARASSPSTYRELGRPQKDAVFTAIPLGRVHSLRSDEEIMVPSITIR